MLITVPVLSCTYVGTIARLVYFDCLYCLVYVGTIARLVYVDYCTCIVLYMLEL